MSKKIVIDPGHGGFDTGAVGYGLQEKNITLDIAVKIRDILANYADVSLTRNSDVFVSLSDRAAHANKVGADLFVSIHVNAGGGTGFESYIYDDAGDQTRHLREIMHADVAAFYQSNGFPDRGMKTAGFAVLRESLMPAVLLENLFIDRSEDARKLKDPGFRKEITGAIAGGVIKTLNLQVEKQPEPPPHWAAGDFARLVKAGLVQDQHNLDSPVTWGEMSAVFARLMDKLNL